MNVAVSSGRFPCRADLRYGLRLYRRDIGGVKFGSAASRGHFTTAEKVHFWHEI